MSEYLDLKTLKGNIDNHVHTLATVNKDGFLAKEDKSKLNSIEAGANNYTHPTSHSASMIKEDSSHRFVSDEEKNRWNNNIIDIEGLKLNASNVNMNDGSNVEDTILENKTNISNLQSNVSSLQSEINGQRLRGINIANAIIDKLKG